MGLLFFNSLGYLESFLALYKAGLVWVRLNYRLGESELGNMMADSQAVALIHGPEFKGAADKICRAVPGVKLRVSQAAGDGLSYEEILSPPRRRSPRWR